MPVGKVLWGAASSGYTYENELLLGYTLYDPVDDRTPRAGSQWLQAPSGVEDAWLTGLDYTLKCEARWIPDSPASTPQRSPVGGPNSWSQFLDYARAKNTFRFVPNAAYPNFWVDGVYLVEPTSGLGALDATKLLRNVPLILRQPNVPWTQAVVRQVALEYAPGQPTTGTGLDAVFTRAGPATYQGKDGLLHTAPSSVARDRCWPSYGSTQHSLRLESSGTNVLQYSALSSQWPAVVLTPNYGTAPDGSTTAALIAGSTLNFYVRWAGATSSLAGTTVGIAASVWISAVDSSAKPQLLMADSIGGANIGNAAITWSSGTPVVTVGQGAGGVEAYGAGWWRFWVAGIPSSSQAAIVQLYPDSLLSSGRTAVWGPQMESAPRPTAYIPTTGAAPASRVGDSFYFPLPAGFQGPQASWWYLRFLDRGTVSSTGYARLLSVGRASPGPNISMEVYAASSAYVCAWSNGAGTVSQVIGPASTGWFGVTLEMLVTVSSSGLGMRTSVAGGADVVSAAGAPFAMPSSFGSLTLALNQLLGFPAGYNGRVDLLALKAGPGPMASIVAARSA